MLNFLVSFGGNDKNFSLPCLNLFHVGNHLFVDAVSRRNGYGRKIRIYHGDRAVLHFSSAITLRVNIRNLF